MLNILKLFALLKFIRLTNNLDFKEQDKDFKGNISIKYKIIIN